MIFNQLNVLPTDDTLDYLSNVMSGSPIDLDITSFAVEVITSQDEIVPDPTRIYNATPTSLRVWYDAYLQRSSLLLSLVSPDLVQRCIQLHKAGVAREFYDSYYPYLNIKPNMPALSRNYKTFILSTANALCGNERPLQFTNEHVSQVDLMSPPNYEYYQAMIANHTERHN